MKTFFEKVSGDEKLSEEFRTAIEQAVEGFAKEKGMELALKEVDGYASRKPGGPGDPPSAWTIVYDNTYICCGQGGGK